MLKYAIFSEVVSEGFVGNAIATTGLLKRSSGDSVVCGCEVSSVGLVVCKTSASGSVDPCGVEVPLCTLVDLCNSSSGSVVSFERSVVVGTVVGVIPVG